MTIEQFIEKLKEFNPKAEIVSITVGNGNEWEYTLNPQVTSHKNRIGEWVFIR